MFSSCIAIGMSETIAILMPVYNGHEFLHESVESVVRQTYKNWVLHIAINGHNTGSDVYNYAVAHRETYIPEMQDKIIVHDLGKTGGKSGALNTLVQILPDTIQWVALLDVDDIWHPEKLSVQAPHLYTKDKPSWSVVGTRCIYFGDLAGIVPDIPTGDLQNVSFLKVNPIINSSAIIRRELCEWEENGIEDYALWLKLKSEGHRFYNCSQILVKHRIHRASAFNASGVNRDALPKLLSKYSDR